MFITMKREKDGKVIGLQKIINDYNAESSTKFK